MTTSATFWVSYGLLWVLLGFQTFILLGLIRVVHNLRTNPAVASGGERYPLVGQTIPSFQVVDTSGRSVASDRLTDHTLLFVSPTCPTCVTTLDELRAVSHKSPDLTVFCAGSTDQCEQLLTQYPMSMPVVIDAGEVVARLLGIDRYPTAVLTDSSASIIRYGQPMRAEDLIDLSRASSSQGAMGSPERLEFI
jgi:hypothetical protein